MGSSTAVPSETEGGDVQGDEAEKRGAAVDKQEDKANGTVVAPKVKLLFAGWFWNSCVTSFANKDLIAEQIIMIYQILRNKYHKL